MQRTTRIEPRPAHWTNRLAIQVLTDAQLCSACPAQHRLLIELSLRPKPGEMAGSKFVTVEAGIIGSAAVEFYGDDIELAAIVRAASARIYLDPSYRNSRNRELQVTLPQISAHAALGSYRARFQQNHLVGIPLIPMSKRIAAHSAQLGPYQSLDYPRLIFQRGVCARPP
jgi:hypothetical protein